MAATVMPCEDCVSGSLHTGTPTGRVTTVHGLPTYVADSESGEPKGIIVFMHDAFGWDLPNNRLLADNYARRTNCRVYLPDFFDGYSIPNGLLKHADGILENTAPTYLEKFKKIPPAIYFIYSVIRWLFGTRTSVTKPRVFKFIMDLRAAEGSVLPIGQAGFCWGGKYTALLCADTEKTPDGKSLIDCGFTAHPSRLEVPADLEAVKLPMSISVGDVDLAFKFSQVQEVQKIFERKGRDFEIVVIPGAKHGFAIRGTEKDEVQAKQAKQAEDQAVDWFNKWLK